MIGRGVHYWTDKLDIASIDQLIANPLRPAATGTRQDLLGFLSDVKELQEKRNWPRNGWRGFDATLPCGCERSFRKDEDIPAADLYCQCGRYMIMKVTEGAS